MTPSNSQATHVRGRPRTARRLAGLARPGRHHARDPLCGAAGMSRLFQNLVAAWTFAVRLMRQLIGVPDYETYLVHRRTHHPERPVPSYAEFFAERQAARYRGGGGRCC